MSSLNIALGATQTIDTFTLSFPGLKLNKGRKLHPTGA